MNSNGVKFYQLRESHHWQWDSQSQGLAFDADSHRIRLRSQRAAPVPDPATPNPGPLIETVPQCRDVHGTRAYWDAGSGAIRATGAAPGSERIDTYDDGGVERSVLRPGETPSDLMLGEDGVLYVALADRVALIDRRGRWSPVAVSLAGLAPWRLAPAEGSGVWVLDRDNGRLARLRGLPLPVRAVFTHAPDVFRPDPEDADPPRLEPVDGAGAPAGEVLVAIASQPGGQLALLTHADGRQSWLRLLEVDGVWSAPMQLAGADGAYSLAWSDADGVSVLLPGRAEAFSYPVEPRADTLMPSGDYLPLPGFAGRRPWVHALEAPPYYLLGDETPGETEPLRRLSLPAFASTAEAENSLPLDSGERATVWDRLYLEGVFPEGCGTAVYLAATDEPERPEADAEHWYAHGVGSAAEAWTADMPRAAWLHSANELPFHPGLLGCERQADHIGCFTALIQRPGCHVRRLRGRYLWVRLALHGNGRATPEVAAVRAYASRFSYRDRYLPQLYHETAFGPDADRHPVAASGSDFLDRFLGLFESVLTPLEDLVAAGYLMTHPGRAPAEALDWLAAWQGLSLDPGSDEPRRRKTIARGADLARWRGTLPGLRLALDLATDDMAAREQLVVVEDFRLRRTFATILGVDFGATDDPLLGGPVFHGNSMLGDTMFFGDEAKREFLALFSADLKLLAKERAAVGRFFDRLAHRVTVLVHDEVSDTLLAEIRGVVQRETPTHLRSRVLRASRPLIIGLSSLLGVETYLTPPPPPEAVRFGASHVGSGDRIISSGSLDPRLEGGLP